MGTMDVECRSYRSEQKILGAAAIINFTFWSFDRAVACYKLQRKGQALTAIIWDF